MEGISLSMTAAETDWLRVQNEAANQALTGQRSASATMGKDEFLRILITQLTNQDPLSPMEDREFIAQMAQFSTLEQMTNLSAEFERLGGVLRSGQAMALLGKNVEIAFGGNTVFGRVEEITGGDYPQVLVNGMYYDYAAVSRVRVDEE